MITYKPDRQGTGLILRETYRAAVTDAAQRIATNVRTQRPDADVVVNTYTTDRSAATVTIREPEARLLQVRDGILTRAAAAAGLEVRAR
jgi:hypothetical protein